MGWWSTDIMGGDSPLDVEDFMFDKAGVEKFPEEGGPGKLSKKWLEKNQTTIIDKMYKGGSPEKDDLDIAYQVLGYWILKVGAKLDNELKIKILNAAETDNWAEGNGERELTMKLFADAVKAYDPTKAVEIKQTGLIETFLNKSNVE